MIVSYFDHATVHMLCESYPPSLIPRVVKLAFSRICCGTEPMTFNPYSLHLRRVGKLANRLLLTR